MDNSYYGVGEMSARCFLSFSGPRSGLIAFRLLKSAIHRRPTAADCSRAARLSSAGGSRHTARFARRHIFLILTLIVCPFIVCPFIVRAQYYDWGQDPASTKWRTIKTPDIKYIFPEDYQRQAVRVMNYMDTVRPHISFGFRRGPMRRTPLVMHTRNFESNGIVMLAPRRIELITTPGADQFAFPWLKQLAAHEYRHAVQYNNLNQGVIRALTWLLGQQGEMVGLAFMPVWAMEGDAVMAETQMSGFGRGLQPSFSMEYRAMLLEGPHPTTIDKYFCGSLRDYMPDHYQLGYQIMSWSWGRYGENILDKTSWFTSRNPYMIFPFAIALKKYYGTTVGGMFTETFDALERYWRNMPLEDNSAAIIETPHTSYTTYASPRAVGDAIVALKTDLDKTSRLVAVARDMPQDILVGSPAANAKEGSVSPRGGCGSTSGLASKPVEKQRHRPRRDHVEQILCRTGRVNSPLAVLGDRIYWTETRRSTFWDQKVNSVLCSYDLTTGRKRLHDELRNVLFPVAAGDTLAWAEYHPEGFYSIAGHALPDTIGMTGLAWEGGKFYFIALDDSGMWIGTVDGEGLRRVTKPSRTTISNLTAGGGALYFNSIASGREEIHKLDLATGKEYRVTTSRYGSFSASPSPDGIVLTTYTPSGYLLSNQEINTDASDGGLTEVAWSELPENTLNPVHAEWDVPNLEDIVVGHDTDRPVRKYRRGLNLFNFHSWAPAYFEPDKLVGEAYFEPHFGVTAMSQNNLNSAYTELGYGHTGRHGIAHAKFKYLGWAPKIEFEARWANTRQLVYGDSETVAPPSRRDNISLMTLVYLPIVLSDGANRRTLTPAVQWNHHNASVLDEGSGRYKSGLDDFSASIQYTETRRLAHRDFLPRFGYNARVAHIFNPTSDDFGKLWVITGRIWLPGIGRHHSLLLSGAWQQQKTKRWLYNQKNLFPRGANYNSVAPEHYRAARVDYALPLAYPDGGINSLLFFSRVRLSAGADMAWFRNFRSAVEPSPRWKTVWSYGADLTVDVHPLRLPTSATATVSLRKPSDNDGLYFGFGFSLPL